MAGSRYNPDTGEYEDIQNEPGGQQSVNGQEATPYTPNPVVPDAVSYFWDNGQAQPIPSGNTGGGQQTAPPPQNQGGGQQASPPPPVNTVPQVGGRTPGDVENELKQRLGGLYDPTILADVIRNQSYNGGSDVNSIMQRIIAKNLLRGTNEVNSTYTPNGQGGFTTGPTGIVNGPGGRQAQARPNAVLPALNGLFTGNISSAIPGQLLQAIQGAQSQAQGAAPTTAGTSEFEDFVRKRLMDLIAQSAAETGDVGDTAAAKGFSRIQERQMQAQRARAAEQRAAQGVGQNQQGEVSGALGADIAGGSAQTAERIAAMQSNLMIQQMNTRRQQLLQALQMGAGVLGADQQRQVQRELAQLDAAIRMTLGQGQLDLGFLNANNQNEQYYSGLGADIGYKTALLNRDTKDFYQ